MKIYYKKDYTVLYIFYMFTIITLVLIYNNPTFDYETSFYSSTNYMIWIFLILSVLGSIIYSIILLSYERNGRFFVPIVFLILLDNFIILSLPELRGYVIYGDADFLTHLGYAKDIILNGHFYENNVYPISHILIANISLVTNISLIQVANYISQYFFILYVSLIFILSKKIFNNHVQAIIILLSSLPFLFTSFQVEFKPQFLSLIVVPMMLYFLFNKSWSSRLLLILLIVLMQFFHPLTSIFFMISTFMMILYELSKKNFHSMSSYRHLLYINIISFILWISNFYYIWDNNLVRLVKWLRGDITTTMPIYGVENSFEKLNLTTFDIIELFFRMFGHILLYLVITIVFIVYYLRFRDKINSNFLGSSNFLDFLVIVFLSGLVLQTINISGGINLKITRGLNYITILSPIFVGLFLQQIRTGYKKIGIIFAILIISSSWIIGVFGIFPSPYIKQPNDQTTNTDIKGSEWFFKYKNPETKFIGNHINIRFSHLVLGIDATYARNDTSKFIIDKDTMIPDHFGYDKGLLLGTTFSKNNYMIISDFDKDLYTIGPWKPVGRFMLEDFENLNRERVLMIYMIMVG